MDRTWPKKEITKKRDLDLISDTKNHEFSEVQFQCIFNKLGFLPDISSKINLHVSLYFIVLLAIPYISL